ncbi:flavin reductase family protein [Frigoribacterium sp. PhB24]|uniref:flavin reductase family protein n=1 Tax=Frigoribacterium sp. PhB24 TaxID=2485204 RepID=UPI000F492764|nr:flavin reductase family protein [Frigoribacterium sp. PhB24]ROS51407.1 flavin reductase (DIM6/NTAB) family NADH-FMN oxidoreductase RutF [Frigoribacterium sp. PhB24]
MTRTTSLAPAGRSVFAAFPSGVAALAASGGDGPDGMVVSSFTVGASFDPPMVTFAARQDSATWARLREAPSLGVSVLAAGQGLLCRRLSSRDRASRFTDVDHVVTGDGAVLVSGAPLRLECVVHREVPAGDHVVVILQVLGAEVDDTTAPLVYHGATFHSLQPIG